MKVNLQLDELLIDYGRQPGDVARSQVKGLGFERVTKPSYDVAWTGVTRRHCWSEE